MNETIENQGASQQAIQDHYDLSNDFYKLWLDKNMVYSGALWRDGDTLEQAQLRKIEHHINAVYSESVNRVLDIGCGWGAVVNQLLDRPQIKEVVGLTLSQSQVDWMNSHELTKRADIRLESWQEHVPKSSYDAIISIGAFEHFAKLEMSDAQKTMVYAGFFDKAQEMLSRSKLMSIQTFAYGSMSSREQSVGKSSTQFLAKEIFKETDPPHLSNIIAAIQGKFEIVALTNDRLGYAKTCKQWLDTLRSKESEAIAIVGEERYEQYLKYLSYSFIGFKSGNLDLYRITLRRVNPRLV